MGGFDNPISANWLSMDYPESNESRCNCCVKVHVQVLSIGQSGPVGNGGQELRRQRTASEDSVRGQRGDRQRVQKQLRPKKGPIGNVERRTGVYTGGFTSDLSRSTSSLYLGVSDSGVGREQGCRFCYLI